MESDVPIQHPGGEEVLLEIAGKKFYTESIGKHNKTGRSFNKSFQNRWVKMLCDIKLTHVFESLKVLLSEICNPSPFPSSLLPSTDVCLFRSPGGEATESFEDVGHSPDAKEQQTRYLIGEVAEPRSDTIAPVRPAPEVRVGSLLCLTSVF